MRSHLTTVQEDGIVQLPQEFINELGWDENTHLMFLRDGDNIILKEKTDWTIDDLQENFEIILERISATGKPHHVLHEGRTFVIVPYSEELAEMISADQTRKETP